MACQSTYEQNTCLVKSEESLKITETHRQSEDDFNPNKGSDKVDDKDPNNNEQEEYNRDSILEDNRRHLAQGNRKDSEAKNHRRLDPKDKGIMASRLDYDQKLYQQFSSNEDDDQQLFSSLESLNSRDDCLLSTLVIEEDRLVYEQENINSDRSSITGSRSSGDETEEDEELLLHNEQSKILHHQAFEERASNHNLNSNNNKKKNHVQDQRNGRSVNFTGSSSKEKQLSDSSSALKRRRFGSKGRFRSVQLSSIRNMHGVRRNKPATWISKKVEYGQRLIEKDGSSNVLLTDFGRADRFSRYFNDIFTTLLDSSWSWVLFITTAVYIGHWIIFGLFYWLFAYWNKDYEKIMGSETESTVNTTASDTDVVPDDPCVYHVYDGITAFLFSMESETTIGYGRRTISTACPAAVACLTLQCIVSAIFDTWVIGMCFARLARPDARTVTTMFSKQAVICKRDGKRCLLVRFANLRKSLLLNVSVRARLVTLRSAQSEEKSAGYQGMLEQRQVTFENAATALLTAPVEYRHVIDKESPFYRIKPDLFNSGNGENYFELVFIVTGTLESTGLTMQAQTSYLSSEILYGHRFCPIVSKSLDRGRYVVDFKHFHETFEEPRLKSYSGGSDIRIRDTTTPLIEETEEDILSASDDVFTGDCFATRQAESTL